MASGLAHASPEERGAGPLPPVRDWGADEEPASGHSTPQAAGQAPRTPDGGPVPGNAPQGAQRPRRISSRGGTPHKFCFSVHPS